MNKPSHSELEDVEMALRVPMEPPSSPWTSTALLFQLPWNICNRYVIHLPEMCFQLSLTTLLC